MNLAGFVFLALVVVFLGMYIVGAIKAGNKKRIPRRSGWDQPKADTQPVHPMAAPKPVQQIVYRDVVVKNNRSGAALGGIVVLVICGFCVAAAIVHPKEGEDSASEIGYIYAIRDELFLREDNSVNLVWFIKIPATGDRYSCRYENGFADFRKGDDVRLIRPKDLKSESGYGYIVGLHEKLTGRADLERVIDVDELEMDARFAESEVIFM